MEYKNMRLPELKALARDRRLRGCYRMRKAELVSLLRAPAPPPPPQRYAVYMTLKFYDNDEARRQRNSNQREVFRYALEDC